MKKITLIAVIVIGMIYGCTREANLIPQNKGYVPFKGVQGDPSNNQTARKYCKNCIETIIPSYCAEISPAHYIYYDIDGVTYSMLLPAFSMCKNNFFITPYMPSSFIHYIDSVMPPSDPIHTQLDTAGGRLLRDSFLMLTDLCKYTEFGQRLTEIAINSGILAANKTAFSNWYIAYKERQDSILYGDSLYIPITSAFKTQTESILNLFDPLIPNTAYNGGTNYLDLPVMLYLINEDLTLNLNKTTAQIRTYYGY